MQNTSLQKRRLEDPTSPDGSKKKVKNAKSSTDPSNTNGSRISHSSPTIPSKRVQDTSEHQSHPDAPSVKIKVQASSDPSFDPIVVSFTSGLPSSIVSAQRQEMKTVRFSDEQSNLSSSASALPIFTWKRYRPTHTKGRMIMGVDDTCTYMSSNEGRGHDGRKTKLYVAIYDKETNELRLIPSAERGTVFSLEQNVTSYQSSHDTSYDKLSEMTAIERRNLLFESFGSSKKLRALKSQAANVVSMESVIGSGEGMMNAIERQSTDTAGGISKSNLAAMDLIRSGGVISKMDAVEKAYAEARRSFLPPFDSSADAPHKVYDSQEIAGDEAWNQITRQVDACIHKSPGEWKSNLLSRSYWHESTKSLLNGIDDPEKKGVKYRIKTIVLLNHLIRFHNHCSTKFWKGSSERIARHCGLPVDVCNRFLQLFTMPAQDRGVAGFSVTKQLKDKSLIYILILYLLAHGRLMKVGSVNKICEEIKLDLKDAAKFLKEAGCKCARDKSGALSVSLSVPLEFPQPKLGKKYQ